MLTQLSRDIAIVDNLIAIWQVTENKEGKKKNNVIRPLALFLKRKTAFHVKYTQFEGNCSIDLCLSQVAVDLCLHTPPSPTTTTSSSTTSFPTLPPSPLLPYPSPDARAVDYGRENTHGTETSLFSWGCLFMPSFVLSVSSPSSLSPLSFSRRVVFGLCAQSSIQDLFPLIVDLISICQTSLASDVEAVVKPEVLSIFFLLSFLSFFFVCSHKIEFK